MGYQFFDGFFSINKYGKMIFIKCVHFLQISMCYQCGVPIWFTWGPHIYFIFIWLNVFGWDLFEKEGNAKDFKCMQNCLWLYKGFQIYHDRCARRIRWKHTLFWYASRSESNCLALRQPYAVLSIRPPNSTVISKE